MELRILPHPLWCRSQFQSQHFPVPVISMNDHSKIDRIRTGGVRAPRPRLFRRAVRGIECTAFSFDLLSLFLAFNLQKTHEGNRLGVAGYLHSKH